MDHSMEQFSFLGVAVLANIVVNGPQNGSMAVTWLCVAHMVLKLFHFYFCMSPSCSAPSCVYFYVSSRLGLTLSADTRVVVFGYRCLP